MFFRRATAQGDVLARVMEVVPAAIEGERAQHQISVTAGMFSQTHLRTEICAVHDVENIDAGELVASATKEFGNAAKLSVAQRSLFLLELDQAAHISRRRND